MSLMVMEQLALVGSWDIGLDQILELSIRGEKGFWKERGWGEDKLKDFQYIFYF